MPLESLQDVAMRQVIANFATHPFSPDVRSGITKETSSKVCSRLPLPTESGGCYLNRLIQHVDNENYWKRASASGLLKTSLNHKQHYVESNLKMLGRESAADLDNVVHGLYLTLPIDKGLVDCAQLNNLAAICLSKASHVKAQLSDTLTQTCCRHLVSLAITNSNLLDQDLLQILAGLGDSSLLHLDLK